MERYHRVSIWLHWIIAGLILTLFPVGLLMEDTPKAYQITIIQMHKSFGLMVLFLSLARLGWRLLNPPPPLPDNMKRWEKLSAKTLYVIFYVLIIAIPISGWAMVSTSPKNIPTMFLTLFHWPHIWFLAQMAVEQKKAIIGDLQEVHEILAYGIIALVVLHIGAAFRHQWIKKDGEMARMVPALGKTIPPAQKPRGAVLVFGGTALIFVLIALMGILGKPAGGKAAPDTKAAIEATGNWVVDPVKSTLTFTFDHDQNPVQGTFTKWVADINFDPDDLGAADVRVSIDMASAATGDATYDDNLPEEDWFYIASYREAAFESRLVKSDGKDGYIMDGELRLRGITLPLSIPFSLVISGDQAEAKGAVNLDRLAYGLGINTDPGATTVARQVRVDFVIHAKHRNPA